VYAPGLQVEQLMAAKEQQAAAGQQAAEQVGCQSGAVHTLYV
jgi:hypothetical protein